jgi:hypothetical protein
VDPVENEVLVHLVGDGDQVAIDAQVGDGGQLVGREHLAGGVVGRVEQEEAGAVGDEGGQRLDVGGVVGRHEGDRPQHGTRHRGYGPVGVVGGLEGEDLVARVAERQDGRRDRLGGAGGDEDLAVRVHDQAPEAGLVVRDRPPQRLDAGTGRVLVLPGADGLDGGLGHLDRAVLVGEPLAEVDGPGGGGQRRHLGEDRRAEACEPR